MTALNFPNPDRSLSLAAKLLDQAVTVARFQGTEELSRPFRFQVEFQSSNRTMAATEVIQQPMLVGIQVRATGSDPRVRYFHGLISRFSYLGEVATPGQPHGTVSRYRAELAPHFFFLTRASRCRIFQNKSVPQILESVLREAGITPNLSAVRAPHPAREYCVQYRESNFDFASRLMEEEGIFYYFRHTENGHEMVLADQAVAYQSLDPYSIQFDPQGNAASPDHISEWEHGYEIRSGYFAHGDFNYLAPSVNLEAQEPNTVDRPGGQSRELSLYDYPGGFSSLDEGRRLAQLRIEEEEASFSVGSGASVCPDFTPGFKFQLGQHPNAAESAAGPYLLTSVQHDASYPASGNAASPSLAYSNRFRCMPAAQVFRPARVTPRPFVRGAQTAIVTGPNESGAQSNAAPPYPLPETPDEPQIYTDELGRVRVRFHWDRLAPYDESSSCWVRVSQGWAGPGYGSVCLPHVGHEVIVSFLEGDPDRPVITGRLYNQQNMPPETLPDNKNRAIVAQDSVGNVIALDADEKRVDIQNAEDKFELTAGEEVSATAGMSVGITLGCDVGINLGASASAALAAGFDVSLGFSSSVFLGGSYDASFGGSFSYAKGNFVNAGDSVGQIAFKAGAEFVSHESVSLAGGSGTENSVVYCASDGLILSFGPTSPTFPGSPKLALGLGVFGAAVIGTLGVAAAGAAAFLGAKASETGEFNDYAKGAVGAGVSSVVLSAVAGGLLTAYAKSWSQVKQPLHLQPLGRVALTKTGIDMCSQKKITLSADNLEHAAIVDFKVDAPKATMSGDLDVQGVFTSKNIMDIGNPAAKAAAKAQAAALRAAKAAHQMAIAAKHAANQAKKAAASMH